MWLAEHDWRGWPIGGRFKAGQSSLVPGQVRNDEEEAVSLPLTDPHQILCRLRHTPAFILLSGL